MADLKKYDYAPNDNLFTGVWDLNQHNLTKYDPYISGYAFIVWTKLPIFFDNVVDEGSGAKLRENMFETSATLSEAFKNLTEKNFKSLSGVGDITLGVEDITHGFAGNAYGVATGISKENTSFSITHQELAGSPMRKLYEYWVTGVRDPETGLATYHGLIGTIVGDKPVRYSAKNHTGELLYIVADPSGKDIEFACYYTNVMPTKIPQDHLNFTNGDHAVAEVSIDFRGNYHTSAEINELAKAYLGQELISKGFYEYNPETGHGHGEGADAGEADRTVENGKYFDPHF